MVNIIRTLLCIPGVNLILFACMPHTAYREFFLGYIESHGKTIEEVWEKASQRERELLSLYNVYKPDVDSQPTPSDQCSQGNQEGADISGVSEADPPADVRSWAHLWHLREDGWEEG